MVGTASPKLSLAAGLSATHLGLFDVSDTLLELWILKDNDAARTGTAAHLRASADGLKLNQAFVQIRIAKTAAV